MGGEALETPLTMNRTNTIRTISSSAWCGLMERRKRVSNPSAERPWPHGETGKHDGFKIRCRKAWGFDSPCGYECEGMRPTPLD